MNLGMLLKKILYLKKEIRIGKKTEKEEKKRIKFQLHKMDKLQDFWYNIVPIVLSILHG